MDHTRKDFGTVKSERTRSALHAQMLLLLVVSASFGAACAPGGDEETISIQRGINSSAACFNTPPDVTFNGSGKVLTTASYNHGTCPSAFMIRLNNYAAENTLGTQAAYVGALPTTQADCEATHMNAYVWRSDGTFLTNVDRRGAWVPDLRGVRHCRLPSVNLEQDTPGYRAGSTWVIGVQAHKANVIQKISFATVKAGTAATMLDHLVNLEAALSAVAAGAVHPAVKELFDGKATLTVARLCRTTQLDKQISALTKPAVIRLGVAAGRAADRDAGLAAIYTGLCTSSGTAAGLQAGLLQYAHAQNAIAANMDAAARGLSPLDRPAVLASVNGQVLGALVSRCGLRPGTVLSFLYDGTLPAGKTGDNLLTGSCSGTLGQVATNLGLGSNFPGDTLDQARGRFSKCLFDAFNQNRCNDPRAAGAPNESTNPPPPPDDAPKGSCIVLDEDRPCTEREANGLTDAEVAQEAAADQMNQQAAADLLLAAEDTALGRAAADHLATVAKTLAGVAGVAAAAAKKVPLTAPVALEVAAWAGTYASVVGAAQQICSTFPETCGAYARAVATSAPGLVVIQRCDGVGNCFPVQSSPPFATQRPPSSGTNRMCAPDFATGGPGWLETDASPGAARPLNQDDRINHCTCELLDGAYAGRSNGIAISAGCPSPEEKFRQDCLTDPYQPRATPNPADPVVKPECLAALSPPVNVVTRMTKTCNTVNCGPGLLRITADDGTCSCAQLVVDPAQALPCRNGLFAMCTDGDPANGSCGCVPQDAVPLGNDPLCRYTPDDANWPGLLAGFSVVNRSDLFVSQINATQQFAMLRPNRSLVGPTIFRTSLISIPAPSTSNPPALLVNAFVSKNPPTGGNVDLQIYITSRGTPPGTQPLTHDFAGQVRLSNLLTPGTPTSVNIPLFAGANQQTMLNRAFSGKSLNVEYTVQAPPAYIRFVGIGSQSFVGASTALPEAGLARQCPRPSPVTATVPVVMPNPIALTATPINPATFTLSTGQFALINDRIPVIRTLAP